MALQTEKNSAAKQVVKKTKVQVNSFRIQTISFYYICMHLYICFTINVSLDL